MAAALSIILVVVFDVILCVVEIPKMLGQKLLKELVTFSVLLLAGTAIVVMKSFDMPIPNPSELVLWFFSPVSGLMKQMLKP